MPKPDAIWLALNERQRAYLKALYDCDQAEEANRRERAARGDWDRTPASEWRWQMYGPVGPPSQLYNLLRAADACAALVRALAPGQSTTPEEAARRAERAATIAARFQALFSEPAS